VRRHRDGEALVFAAATALALVHALDDAFAGGVTVAAGWWVARALVRERQPNARQGRFQPAPA